MGHLTSEQRYTISEMNKNGYSQVEIAKVIGKDKSVVCRELKRNSDQRSGEYKADLAQRKYQKRQKQKPKRKLFTKEIERIVNFLISRQWSPEQIKGTCKKKGTSMVSHERIYQYIWEDKKQGGELYKSLRTKGKKYRKRGDKKDSRGRIKNRVDIQQRPNIVEERSRFGDFEIDTVVGLNHKGFLVTITDRATGMLYMDIMPSKHADITAQATVDLLKPIKHLVHTITADNGKEFASHELIAQQLETKVFFAKPYRSWERGTNENTNGLIRQYFPKKMSFENITKQEVKWVQEKLNRRPRKRLNYSSPYEKYCELITNSEVAFVG